MCVWERDVAWAFEKYRCMDWSIFAWALGIMRLMVFSWMYWSHYVAGSSEYGLLMYRLLFRGMDYGNDVGRVSCYEGWTSGVNCVSINVSASLCSGKLGVWLVYIQAIIRRMDCCNDFGRVSFLSRRVSEMIPQSVGICVNWPSWIGKVIVFTSLAGANLSTRLHSGPFKHSLRKVSILTASPSA